MDLFLNAKEGACNAANKISRHLTKKLAYELDVSGQSFSRVDRYHRMAQRLKGQKMPCFSRNHNLPITREIL